ncbi:hypothetical protein GGS20DRAFT_154116 [Poronia punctata]|nr:hypothetical protein GGS20DRAFT_154116 [Poronia punctata]
MRKARPPIPQEWPDANTTALARLPLCINPIGHHGSDSLPELQADEGSPELPNYGSIQYINHVGSDTISPSTAFTMDPLFDFNYQPISPVGDWFHQTPQRNPHTVHDDSCLDKCNYGNLFEVPLNFAPRRPWPMSRARGLGSLNPFMPDDSIYNSMGNTPNSSFLQTLYMTQTTPGMKSDQSMMSPDVQAGPGPGHPSPDALDFTTLMSDSPFSPHPTLSPATFSTGDLGQFPRGQKHDESVFSSFCAESHCCYPGEDCFEDHCDGDDCQVECQVGDCHEDDCHEDNCTEVNCNFICTNTDCLPRSPFGDDVPAETPPAGLQGNVSLDVAGQDPCPLPHDQPSNHTRIEHNVAQTLQVLSAQGTLDARTGVSQPALSRPLSPDRHVTCACLWVTNPGAPQAERRICGEQFSNEEELDKHVCGAHTTMLNSRTRYTCLWDGCARKEDQYFTSRAKLDRHIPTHTGYKPMTCRICGVSLSSQQALEQHERTHTRERPYKCDKCGKDFTTKSSLITHKRIHDGSKPLRCDVCGKEFGDSSNLSKHKATHQTKTRHCTFPGCGKSFRRNDQLERHQKIHQNRKGERRADLWLKATNRSKA